MAQLYDDVERAMADSCSKYKITTRDFNAKIGTKTKEEDIKSMGAFGIGERNERGDRLIEFAEDCKLVIANTLFLKRKNRYWTWESLHFKVAEDQTYIQRRTKGKDMKVCPRFYTELYSSTPQD